jgi:hypothetical protein
LTSRYEAKVTIYNCRSSELPLAQLVGQTHQVIMLLVGGSHEPGKLGGRKRRNFTVVKSDEPVT